MTLAVMVCLELGCGTESGAPAASFDVDAVIRQVHFSYRPEQGGWRGGHSTYEVKATAQGLALTPVYTRQVEQGEPEHPESSARLSLPPTVEVAQGTPLLLGTARVARGDVRLSVEAPQGQVEADGHLSFTHGEVVEHLRNSEQGVEQSWAFESAPSGSGELQVDISVKGLGYTQTSEHGLHFTDAQTGLGFRYGHGTWVDGQGRRTPIPAAYVDGQIQLRVPEQVLATSVYPAVLDPIVTQEMFIDGRLVTADTAVRTHAALAFNGTNYLVVWRNVRGNLSSIYGTRVSTTGAVLDSAGIVVSNGPGFVAMPFVASNGVDFYVVWAQNSYAWKVMGTQVTGSGTVSNPGGVRLTTASNNQYWPRVASNGDGYLVAWYQYSSFYDADVYARQISSTGQLASTYIPIAIGSAYNESTPSVAANDTVYLVAWEDERDGYSRAYATRVSYEGGVLDVTLEGTGFPLSIADLQYNPTVASNGEDFLAVWLDYRSGIGRDLYGTRVTGSGSVLDGPGFAVAADPNVQESYVAVASNDTDYLVAWTAWDDSNATFQTLASRVSSATVSSSPVQDTTSLVLSPSGGTYRYPAVVKAGTDYLVAWDGNGLTPGTTDLYSAWVSSSAGTITAGSGFPVTATVTSLYQTEPAVASNGTNYLVVWTETAGGSIQIYGARVTREGGTIDVPPLVITAEIRERQTPVVASNGVDYFVAWMDYRDVDWNIYGARVLATGPTSSAVLDTSGIAISTDSAFQNAPDVASDGTDYLVVWRQDAGGNRGDIYGARVTSGGVVQDTSGIAIATNTVEHYTPRVAASQTGYFVVWAEYQSSTAFDVHGARVSTAGLVLDSPSIPISNSIGEQYDPDVASDGTDYFVVWTDYRSGTNNDIYGARVSGAGVVQDTSGLALCTETVNQHAPQVVYDGTSYLAAWADYRYDTYWDVFATRVTLSGSVTTPGGFGVVYNARETDPHLALASGLGGQSFVTFSRYDTEPGVGSRRIRGQFISF
ncbi:hypothetical protein [Hyalangium sp.]|uniref:hypothetical protein n=1 Tax=Hyalangium sp. TaxID=2028555 RepID=UPI002D418DE3|nr:hypothetical protein [Hyalangium sp.]HYI00274.1 hypothetical protein [Hyalangium sp.]